jgi:hypothetical protein
MGNLEPKIELRRNVPRAASKWDVVQQGWIALSISCAIAHNSEILTEGVSRPRARPSRLRRYVSIDVLELLALI